MSAAGRPPEGGARVPLGGTGRQAEGAPASAVGRQVEAGPSTAPAARRPAAQALPALRQAWREQSVWGRRLSALTLLALLVAVTLAGALTPAWQREADADEQAALAAQRSWRQRPAPPVAATAMPGWRSSLPDASAADARLAELLDSAARHGLSVARSQQQWRELAPASPLAQPGRPDMARTVAAVAAAEPGVGALQLTMMVDGSYADLRAWVGDALAADPQLALDALRLQRPSAVSTQFSAELQWALLQRVSVASAARDALVARSLRGAEPDAGPSLPRAGRP